MAIYPCDAGPHRYPQPQQSAYRTTVVNNSAVTLISRLCPKHFREVQVVCLDDLMRIDDDSAWSSSCDSCSGPPSTLVSLRLFPNKAEEQQYAGQFCDECAAMVVGHLSVTTWRPLPDR